MRERAESSRVRRQPHDNVGHVRERKETAIGMAAVVARRAVRASMAQRKAQGEKRTGQELKGCEQVVVKNVLR